MKINRNHQYNINSYSYRDSDALPDQTFVIPKIRQKLQLSPFSEILRSFLFLMQMRFNVKSPLLSLWKHSKQEVGCKLQKGHVKSNLNHFDLLHDIIYKNYVIIFSYISYHVDPDVILKILYRTGNIQT